MADLNATQSRPTNIGVGIESLKSVNREKIVLRVTIGDYTFKKLTKNSQEIKKTKQKVRFSCKSCKQFLVILRHVDWVLSDVLSVFNMHRRHNFVDTKT